MCRQRRAGVCSAANVIEIEIEMLSVQQICVKHGINLIWWSLNDCLLSDKRANSTTKGAGWSMRQCRCCWCQ
jgi:hypothetical protein